MLNALRSIQFRLTLWFVSVLAIAIVFASVVLYFGLQRALMANVDTTLRRAAERSVRAMQEPQEASEVPGEHKGSPLVLFSLAPTRLIGLDGVVADTDALFPPDLPLERQALDGAARGVSRYETLTLGSGAYRVLTAPVRVEGERVAVVQVAQSLATEQATLASLRNLLFVVVPATLFLATLGGALLAQRAFSPMERVRRDVETIIDDTDLSRRVGNALAPDEVGRLAHTFDRLLERVETAMARERQFSADASHELRSPLTALKGELSVALSRDRSAADYREVLIALESAVDDMSVMVEDLLSLSRSSAAVLNLERMDMAELARQVCDRLSVVAAERGVALAVDGSAQVWMRGDRLKLQRVLTNLVDNAIRYTPKGGSARVQVEASDEQVAVRVRDTGIGIAPEHQARIFDRFYRADTSRARDVGGTGLGLAIAQVLVFAHNGRITVKSQPGHGSEFAVWLPRRDAS